MSIFIYTLESRVRMTVPPGRSVAAGRVVIVLSSTTLFAAHVMQLPQREGERQYAEENDFDQQVHR